MSADQREYVFKLRRDVVFHDGTPLTADDVRFSLEVVCHKDNARITELYVRSYVQIRGCREFHEGEVDRVEGIEVLDSHALRVRLANPSTAFLYAAAANGVLPRARYGSIPVSAMPRHPLARAPIGTGPFALVEWREGDRIVLEANPRYFLGRPKLDGLVIRFIDDPATQLLELKNGGLHFGTAQVAPQDFEAAAGSPLLVPKAYRGAWQRYLAMDLTDPLFVDIRVRRALSHAFDRERMLKDAWGGRGRIANGPLDPALREFNSRIPIPAYDPELAMRLLAEAGWEPGPDGVLKKSGRRFEFVMLAHPGPAAKMAILYQYYLRRIGMDARIETLDFPTLFGTRLRPGKFQASSFELGIGIALEPSHNLGYFQCGVSRFGYCSRDAEPLIAMARTALDPGDRGRIYRQLQEVLARDLPVIWTVNPDDLRLVSSKLVLPDRQSELFVVTAVKDWDLRD